MIYNDNGIFLSEKDYICFSAGFNINSMLHYDKMFIFKYFSKSMFEECMNYYEI